MNLLMGPSRIVDHQVSEMLHAPRINPNATKDRNTAKRFIAVPRAGLLARIWLLLYAR